MIFSQRCQIGTDSLPHTAQIAAQIGREICPIWQQCRQRLSLLGELEEGVWCLIGWSQLVTLLHAVHKYTHCQKIYAACICVLILCKYNLKLNIFVGTELTRPGGAHIVFKGQQVHVWQPAKNRDSVCAVCSTFSLPAGTTGDTVY